MPFEPRFMKERDAFEAEKRKVTTREQWLAFRKKWFDTGAWPRKSPQQRAQESDRNQSTVELGGRRWGYLVDVYDLTPEARYIYSSTYHGVGDPLVFPVPAGEPKLACNGWRQHCPYCELCTSELGDETCPQCSRPLVYIQFGD